MLMDGPRTPTETNSLTHTTAMSATDPNPQTTNSPVFVHTRESFSYAVTHVFFPVQLPEKSDYTPENDHALARTVCVAAHTYHPRLRNL